MARRSKTKQQSTQPDSEEKPKINPINAVIGSTGIIIVAIIGYLATVTSATLPIEATQTAEALHTSIAMTTAAKISGPTSTDTPTVVTPIAGTVSNPSERVF